MKLKLIDPKILEINYFEANICRWWSLLCKSVEIYCELTRTNICRSASVLTYKLARTRRTVRFTWTTTSGNSSANTCANRLKTWNWKVLHIIHTSTPDEEKEQGWYVDGEDASRQRSSQCHRKNQLSFVCSGTEKNLVDRILGQLGLVAFVLNLFRI